MMMPEDSTKVLLTLLGTSAIHWLSAAWLRYRKNKRFIKVGTVSGLTLFPIKSCKGIQLQSATAEVTGLHDDGIIDRQWMVVRPNGDFLTQRQCPKMALVKISCQLDNILIETPGQPSLVLPKNPTINTSKYIMTRVWESRVVGMDCGEEAARWFSSFLGMDGLRLVVSTKSMPKRDSSVEVKPWENLARTGDLATFGDFGAYLIMNEASLDALNKRLDSKVTMDNFRPNIIIKGSQAFDEDNWQEIRIGNSGAVSLRILDPCTRCLLTTVNPQTGEKDKKRQPLETLKQFRCFPKYGIDPIFGVNAAIDNVGIVKVGDPVYALLT